MLQFNALCKKRAVASDNPGLVYTVDYGDRYVERLCVLHSSVDDRKSNDGKYDP